MPYILKNYYSPRKLFFFVGEALLIFFSVNLIYVLLSGRDPYLDSLILHIYRTIIFTAIFLLCLYFFDLYDLGEILHPPDVASRALQAFGIGCIMLAFIYYFFPITVIPGHIFWPGLFAVSCSVALWRFLYNQILNRKMFSQMVIIVGAGKMAADIASELVKRRDAGFSIAHFIGTPSPDYPLPADIPVTSEVKQLPDLCRRYHVERVVVAMDDRRGNTPIQELMDCKFMGFPVEYGINFYEKLTGKILVEKVNPDWIIFSSGFKKSRLTSISKGTFEMLLALIGLVAVSPLLAISALIIKLESPGPVFYRQERVGLHGKTFKLIKLRSMRSDAEKDGPVWAMENDTRVTRFGNIIRKTRIDELPQMLNVLMGDMSFVGPRPERPVFVEKLIKSIPYYALRHNVKPGISGWAQICYPYGASEKDALRKLEYDLFYVKYMSIQMDFWVMFQTIKIMLFLKGSR
jgi:sugar transferase (PEP-CTERM system associated)